MDKWWNALPSTHLVNPEHDGLAAKSLVDNVNNPLTWDDASEVQITHIGISNSDMYEMQLTTQKLLTEDGQNLYIIAATELINVSDALRFKRVSEFGFEHTLDLRILSEILDNLSEAAKTSILRSNTHIWKIVSLHQKDEHVPPMQWDKKLQKVVLKRAKTINLDGLKQVPPLPTNLSIQFDRLGHLTISFFREHIPRVKVFTDKFTVQKGKLLLSGHYVVHRGFALSGRVELQARTSAYAASVKIKVKPNEQSLKDFIDHLRYDFSVVYDFENDFDQITNDAVDLYLDIDLLGSRETVRKRIGITRYLVRRKTQPSSITKGERTLNIVPYYTYIAKNPSIQFEHFETKAYKALTKAFKGKLVPIKSERPIWLIGEVPYKAQDNGMWLFQYLQQQCPDIDSYYVMDKSSVEFQNVSFYKEKVIQFRSEKHISLLLSAERVIGTHQPLQMYPTRDPRIRKRIHAKHVFLQHGVTAAKWIEPVNGKRSNDFTADLIIVNSEKEKEFFTKDCGYDAEQVAVTGFARFDELFKPTQLNQQNNKELLVIPTWRPWLQDYERFTDSDYFLRWTDLLKDERLNAYLKSRKVQLTFCLHPNMQQYSSLFEEFGARVVFQGKAEVQQLIKKASILLTDYSSVAFDAIFIDKPVIFYQFDSDRFPEPHADPITELPGPVLTNKSEVISKLIGLFDNNAHPEPIYRKRAEAFLFRKDQNNRSRIVSAIKKIPSKHQSQFSRFKQTELRSTIKRFLEPSTSNRKYYIFLYRVLRKITPLDPQTIVFETNLARSFSDSPEAIFRELLKKKDTRKFVIVNNRKIRDLPKEVVQVKRHSLGFIWYLATAKYWINNHNFPDYVKRRKHGIYIQTWHGTPLKKMFMDQENFYGRDSGYIKRVKKMSSQWNNLVSPSKYFTNALRSSYQYKGKVHELGHARNDILFSKNSRQIRDSERFKLNIDDNKFVVMYAPTFRDDRPSGKGKFEFNWPFSPEEFYNHFGDDVVLLIRKHNLISTKLEIPEKLASHIIDVSKHENVNQLFLATDLLITDYSSLFFDYALTNRPIIFYAYDLEHYKEKLRGFYLDYFQDLPGPIVQDKKNLFETITFCRQNTSSISNWVPNNFSETFAPHDDGKVSARIISSLL